MDIQKITQDLLSTGLTQQQLATLASCSQSAINAFASGKRGSRPSLTIGTRLLALHQERCKATDFGHVGRQLPSTNNMLDSVPDHSVIVVACGPSSHSGIDADIAGRAR
jgi:predicted transcriptional regulator